MLFQTIKIITQHKMDQLDLPIHALFVDAFRVLIPRYPDGGKEEKRRRETHLSFIHGGFSHGDPCLRKKNRFIY